jgi:hypothetical protein
MVRVLKKNPENKFFSQMYEVFDLNEAYVVWKITIELKKTHGNEATKSKPEEHEIPSKSKSMVKNTKHAVFYDFLKILFF